MSAIRFEWDEAKDRMNRRKHRISFETAKLVFADPFHMSRHDRIERDEDRWQTIGRLGEGAIVLVAHALRFEGETEVIRIISARKANKKERGVYEEQQID